jgi:tight adherence protein B
MNRVKNLLLFIIPAGVISILLYDSLLAVLPLFILYPGFIKLIKKSEYKKRDYKISKEFIVFLTSMSGALNAGYALENTLEIIRDDLIKEFSSDSILANECDRAINMISLKMSFNNDMYDMAKELSNKDIDTFAEVLSISKNVGGDLIEMIDLTINQVKDRIETNEDIAVLVSAKKL